MNLDIKTFEDLCDDLFAIEIKSVEDVVKQAKKEGKSEESHQMMAMSYLKGLQRSKEIVTIVLKSMEKANVNS